MIAGNSWPEEHNTARGCGGNKEKREVSAESVGVQSERRTSTADNGLRETRLAMKKQGLPTIASPRPPEGKVSEKGTQESHGTYENGERAMVLLVVF